MVRWKGRGMTGRPVDAWSRRGTRRVDSRDRASRRRRSGRSRCAATMMAKAATRRRETPFWFSSPSSPSWPPWPPSWRLSWRPSRRTRRGRRRPHRRPGTRPPPRGQPPRAPPPRDRPGRANRRRRVGIVFRPLLAHRGDGRAPNRAPGSARREGGEGGIWPEIAPARSRRSPPEKPRRDEGVIRLSKVARSWVQSILVGRRAPIEMEV